MQGFSNFSHLIHYFIHSLWITPVHNCDFIHTTIYCKMWVKNKKYMWI